MSWKIFRLDIYLGLSTCQGMQLLSSIVIVSDEELSCQLDAIDLLFCMVLSLVISIGRNNGLDDQRLPSEMPSD